MVSWSFANIVKDGKADGEENVECRIYRSTKEIKLSIAAKKKLHIFSTTNKLYDMCTHSAPTKVSYPCVFGLLITCHSSQYI